MWTRGSTNPWLCWTCVRTCVCALTFAGLRFRFEDKPCWARAGIGARSVSAQTVVTKQTVHQTLIYVCTQVKEGINKNTIKCELYYSCVSIEAAIHKLWKYLHKNIPSWLTNTVFATGVSLIANVTDAAVASSQVLTYAILTNVWVQCTLIDV